MLFRRGSSVHHEAQRQAVVRGLLKPGMSFDMVSGQYLDPKYMHGKRRIATLRERFGDFFRRSAEKAGTLAYMDGAFFQDTRMPFMNADISSVTLATTDKAVYPVANFPVLGSNYWGFVGKKLQINLFGRMTTVLTPGNGVWDVYWGNGTDANGTIIVSSLSTRALAASQTNLSWSLQVLLTCRSTGATGTIMGTGVVSAHNSLTTVAGPMLLPDSAPAVSGSLDLTLANIISVQFKRSGSTAETLQVHDGVVASLN